MGDINIDNLRIKILEHLPNRILVKEEDYKDFNEQPLRLNNRDGQLILTQPTPVNKKSEHILMATKYPEYYEDRKWTGSHYGYLYQTKQVYRQYIPLEVCPVIQNHKSRKIPYTIFQTFETEGVTRDMWDASKSWYSHNTDYHYSFYNNTRRREFIEKSFGQRTLNAYDSLVPGAYKADLWKYCIMYVFGGVYADIDSTNITPIEFDKSTDCVLCVDNNPRHLKTTFFAICSKSNIALAAIASIVNNVEFVNYGNSDTEVTGSKLLENVVRGTLNIDKALLVTPGKYTYQIENKPFQVEFWKFNSSSNTITQCDSDKDIIHNKYQGYDDERLILGGSDWALLWRENRVFIEGSSKSSL